MKSNEPKKGRSNGGTFVQVCTCTHTAQDKLHGPAKRVHNRCNGGGRCTVCAKVASEGAR